MTLYVQVLKKPYKMWSMAEAGKGRKGWWEGCLGGRGDRLWRGGIQSEALAWGPGDSGASMRQVGRNNKFEGDAKVSLGFGGCEGPRGSEASRTGSGDRGVGEACLSSLLI